MIHYKDRTFCSSEVEKHKCGRELTAEDKKRAAEIGLPIAYGEFCNPKHYAETKLEEISSKNLPPEIGKLVSENFWNLI